MPKWFFVLLQNCRDVKKEVFEKKMHFLFLSLLCCCKRNRKIKTQKGKRPKILSNRVCKVVIQKWEKWKKRIFGKNAWHYLCQEGIRKCVFSCALSVLAKFFLDQNGENQKNYKNSGVSGHCPKPKMTPFLEKGVFLKWAKKVGFTNCVFEKLCSSETLCL